MVEEMLATKEGFPMACGISSWTVPDRIVCANTGKVPQTLAEAVETAFLCVVLPDH